MRRKCDYTDYWRDSLDAAQKAERFIVGVEFEAFQANSTLHDMLPQQFLNYRNPALSRILSDKSQRVS
jgi:hypothetical protein